MTTDTKRRPANVILPPDPNLISALTRIAKKHNQITHVLSPIFDFYFVTDPELIKEVLVTKHRFFAKGDFLQRTRKVFGEGLLTSEGSFHHRQRQLVRPAFHTSRLNSYADTIVSETDELLGSWSDGKIVDIHREMTRLTMAIIAKCLFDEDLQTGESNITRALSDVIEYFNRLSSPFGWLLEKLPINSRYESAVRSVDKMIYGLINERRKNHGPHQDMLSMLLEAKDADGVPMSNSQVRDEALILFAAGHETTANALSWTWYLISRYPEARDKLLREIDSLFQFYQLRLADMSKLTYTARVISESLRLYPPVWILTRQATAAVSVGQFLLPAGAEVLVSQYVMHHDARYFPRPEKFDPDRWTQEMKVNLPKFAYFPFGAGPRSCVGEQFAWIEAILVIGRILSNWKLDLILDQDVKMLPRITLRPKRGIQMRVAKRH